MVTFNVMYTPTQLEVIKIFEDPQRKLDKQIIKMKYGTCISYKLDEVHLEDIFRVAKENEWLFEIRELPQEASTSLVHYNYFLRKTIISYNPTIPVLEQSEETLEQLISIFK